MAERTVVDILRGRLTNETSRKMLNILVSSEVTKAITAYFRMPARIKASLIEAYDSVEERNLAALLLCYELFYILAAEAGADTSFDAFMAEIITNIVPASKEQNQ